MASKITALKREDVYEVPMLSLREAVINAVVHRSYIMEGCRVYIRIYPDRISVESPGSPLGLDLSDPMRGLSKQRNPVLAATFRYAGLMEEFGTGVPRMFKECRRGGYADPELSDRDGFFTVTFRRKDLGSSEGGKSSSGDRPVVKHGDTREAVLDILEAEPDTTLASIAERIGFGERYVGSVVSSLKKEGVLVREGAKKSGRWVVIRDNDKDTL